MSAGVEELSSSQNRNAILALYVYSYIYIYIAWASPRRAKREPAGTTAATNSRIYTVTHMEVLTHTRAERTRLASSPSSVASRECAVSELRAKNTSVIHQQQKNNNNELWDKRKKPPRYLMVIPNELPVAGNNNNNNNSISTRSVYYVSCV